VTRGSSLLGVIIRSILDFPSDQLISGHPIFEHHRRYAFNILPAKEFAADANPFA
jgi:hypothetical protein